jgi:hypothetical protein
MKILNNINIPVKIVPLFKFLKSLNIMKISEKKATTRTTKKKIVVMKK